MKDESNTLESLRARLEQLEAESTRSAKVQAALYKVAEAVSSSEDLRQFYAALHTIIGELMYAGNFFISVLDAQTGMLSWPYHVDEKDLEAEVWEPEPLAADRGTTGYVIRTGKSLHAVSDYDRLVDSGEIRVIGTRSLDAIVVPLRHSSSVLGALAVQSYTDGIGYTEEDVHVLEFVASHIATALTRARAIEETRRRNAELQIINSVQAGLAQQLSLQAIYELVGEKLLEIFQVDTVGIVSYDPDTRELTDRYSWEKGDRTLIAGAIPLFGFRKHVVETRQTMLINRDVEELGRQYDNPILYGATAKSCIFVPILVGERATGVVSLQDMGREDAFSESDVNLLEMLTGAMGVALENARLFDETQRLLKETEQRAAELAIINSIQQALAAKLDIHGIYEAVGERISQIFPRADVGLRIYDAETGLVHFPYAIERGKRLEINSLPLSAGVTRHVFQTRAPLMINTDLEATAAKLGSSTLPGTDTEKSGLWVPILVGNEARGLLELLDMDHENAFSEGDVRLLTTISNSLSVALENARLFDETQRLLKETEQRAAELAIINSVQEGLASKLEMQDIYELVGEKIRQTFGADTAYIAIYDPKQREFRIPYYVDQGKHLQPSTIPLGKGITSEVFEKRGPLLLNTSEEHKEAALHTGYADPSNDRNESYLGVPILVGAAVTGVLSVQSHQKSAYDDAQAQLLSTLASSMSVALENARLFAETQRLLKETELRAAELQIINSVQEGLAAQLELQAMYDLVGDKIREIFDAQIVNIRIYHAATDTMSYPYVVQRGERVTIPPNPVNRVGLNGEIMRTGKPLLLEHDLVRRAQTLGSVLLPGYPAWPKTWLGVPIVTGGQVTGIITIENFDKEYAYGESDVKLLSTLAASMGAALESARLFKAEQQRVAELAIINSVQEALASKLEIKAIYDVVGDRIREVFDAQAVIIGSFDHEHEQFSRMYMYEDGKRFPNEIGLPFTPLVRHLIDVRQPVVLNENAMAEGEKYGLTVVPGTRDARSMIFVPFGTAQQVNGLFSLQNIDREHAFPDSDVRLLQTLAGSMGIALENARLFDETQRLLKETEQRAAELAIINSVQQGLASKMEMQSIYDLVGEQIRETFRADTAYIAVPDEAHKTFDFPYYMDSGQRLSSPGLPIGRGLTSEVFASRVPLMLNSKVEMAQHDSVTDAYENASKDLNESFLGVPVLLGDRVSGVVSVQSHKAHAYAENDMRLLQTLANSMSVALESARLFDETQRLLKVSEQRAAELSSINTVSQGLVAEADLERMIQLVGDELLEIFDPDIAYVALLNRESGMIEFPYQHGDEMPPMPAGQGLTGKIIETGTPLLINHDIARRRAELGTKLVGKQAVSYLGVPILAGGEVIGAISVQSTREQSAFSEDDSRLLGTIAANTGAAIQTARLHTETRRRAQEMATLAEIGNDIAGTRELEPVLQRIAEHALSIMRVRDIAITLREEDGGDFHTRVALGRYADEMKKLVVRPGLGIMGMILQSGQAEFVNDPQNDSRRVTVPGTPEQEEEPECLMGAPLISRGEVIGGLMVWRLRKEGLFTQAELDFLVSVARQTTIAIESARLYLETQRRANEMSALAEVGREISASLDKSAVLELIADRAMELLTAENSAVFLLEPQGTSMRAIAARGDAAEQLRAELIAMGEGIIGSLAAEGRAEFINDVFHDRRGIVVPGMHEPETERLMAAPLMRGDKVVGMLAVWRTTAPFSQADLNFLIGLSRQAAIALENARLFDEIKRQGAYLETIFQNSPVAIITVDEGDRVMSWNPGAEQLFGYSKEEAIDRNMDELVAGTAETLSQARDYNQQARRHELHVITQRTRKDRSLVDVELSGVPLTLPSGESGLVAIYHDITELQRARQQAVAANEAKSAFLATMSHEIRTPMNAVIGMSGLLMDTPLNPEQRDYAETIRNSGDALLTIINDILDFSKIEAGKMELESQPFDLRECVESAMDLVAGRANEKKLDLAYIIEDEVPPGVRGDVTRLRQVLLNLISNAVKFTEKGEVVLTVRADKEPDRLLISVRDSGIGIPRDRMGRLFESFSQADSSTTRKFGGTGLGLAISKRLAEMMGGTMWADSAGAGKGSTFSFTLRAPAARVTTRKSVRELNGIQPALNGKHVLIVDDNDTNRRILMLQTGKWGMRPRETASPREALRLLKTGAEVDLAILDVQMPAMDGVTLAREVRKLRSRTHLPLILLTSLGRKEAGAEDLDVAAFLTKPLKPSGLFDALVGIFGQPIAVPRAESSKAAIDVEFAREHPLRILLAEDNAVNQKLALRLLEQMGYRADVASNGVEAVESIERQGYDVVLMDVQMPEMDGLDATRAIRKLTGITQPRVIAMTANAMQGDREMCLAAGMDDYVSKPIRVAELIEALRGVRRQSSKPAARARQKPPSTARSSRGKSRTKAGASASSRTKPRRAAKSGKK